MLYSLYTKLRQHALKYILYQGADHIIKIQGNYIQIAYNRKYLATLSPYLNQQMGMENNLGTHLLI